jgi:hypothetical protein
MGIEFKENTKKMRDTSTGKKKAYFVTKCFHLQQRGLSSFQSLKHSKVDKEFFLAWRMGVIP